MSNNTIGKLIAELRKEKEMTQKELADKLNITDRAVSKWERGICCPDISLLEDLSKILDIPVHNLIIGKRNNEKITEKTINSTIKYASNSNNKKILTIINNILIGIIIISLLLLIFFNIKLQIQFNGKYKTNYYPINLNSCLVDFDKIKSNINIILNNQGVYTDEDYKYIVNSVEELKDNILIDKDKLLFDKDYYTYKDLIDFYNQSWDYYIYTSLYRSYIYYKLINYDKEIFNSLEKYYRLVNNYNNSLSELQEFYINNIYYINNFSTDNVTNNFVNTVCSTYQLYSMVLEDIIRVGEINE